jgi:hypothetical protein
LGTEPNEGWVEQSSSPTRKGVKSTVELGKKDEIFGADKLKPIALPPGRPETMPRIQPEEQVICGYDQGLGERMIVCESLEDMQTLYDAYARGGALGIQWYTGEDPGFITVVA